MRFADVARRVSRRCSPSMTGWVARSPRGAVMNSKRGSGCRSGESSASMPGPLTAARGHVVDPSFFTLLFHLLGSKSHAQVQNLLQLSTSAQSFPDGGTVARHMPVGAGAWACEGHSDVTPATSAITACAT